ncbi:MAG: acyl-CoA synthetase [Burkholderiaceae bacterium]
MEAVHGGRGVVPLDLTIGHEWPALASAEEVLAFESVELKDRLAVHNTYDAIRIGASLNPDAPAIELLLNASVDDVPVTLTYRQFMQQLTQAANLFGELGVGPNDVVSLLLPLVPQNFISLFGAEAAGIANPVNPLLAPHQLREILAAANTKVLVALGPVPDTDIWQKVEQIRADLPELKAILWVGAPPDPSATLDAHAKVMSFDESLASQPGDRLMSERVIAADDTAAYFHTGGTTGTPKLVPHTHLNQVYQAWAMNLMFDGKPDKLLFGLPLFHVGGALTQALPAFTTGTSLVVLSPLGWRHPNAVAQVWRLIEKYRPVSFSGVPTVLTGAAGIPLNGADVSSLRRSAGGGSAIPVAIAQSLQDKTGKPVIEVYGMTETASVHCQMYPNQEVRLGSAGIPLPYSRVRIVKLDAQGRLQGDCAVDEIGVIAMSGPGVFTGYLNPIHNDAAFVEAGWVNSGDLGRLDADGYLWITGRAKDLVIRGSHNIDPAPLEELLYQHPDVALPAIVGQPDAHAGELPLAYVQFKPGASATPEQLLDYLRDRTPERAAVPVDLIPIETMPLTGVGKVFKPSLRWDAAQRVFSRLLTPLMPAPVSLSVTVGAHGTHGTLATISLQTSEQIDRAGLEQQIRQALAPFVISYEIQWL